MKKFGTDFDLFLELIKSKTPFALSRYGDGELMIIEGNKIDLRKKRNGEFNYMPNTEYDFYRNKLIESFKCDHKSYHVGIACRCCVGDDKHEYMKKTSGLSEERLTWANIFVNSNYNRFISEMLPLFSNYKEIILVANKKSDISKLSFKINRFWGVGADAWKNDYHIIEDIKSYLVNKKNALCLFSAGPLANILVKELFEFREDNTYIDCGSVFDSIMLLGKTRGYLKGASTLKKECIW